MENEVQGFSNISDVGYLLTRLRLARTDGDKETAKAILRRFEELGLLNCRGEEGDENPCRNLRSRIEAILGPEADEFFLSF